jgi:FtsZ-binding cell division protein ZapB
MKSIVRIFIALALFSDTTVLLRAQSDTTVPKPPSSVHRRQPPKSSTPSIEAQIKEMREDLQTQINELKAKLATRDEQIEALKTETLNTQQVTATASTKIHDIDSTLQQNATAVDSLQASVTDLREKDVVVSNNVQQVRDDQNALQRASMNQPRYGTRASQSLPAASWPVKAYGVKEQ